MFPITMVLIITIPTNIVPIILISIHIVFLNVDLTILFKFYFSLAILYQDFLASFTSKLNPWDDI